MAAGNGKRIARIRLGQIGRQLQPFTLHSIRWLAQLFGQSLDSMSQLGHSACRRLFNELTRCGKVTKRQAVQNRLLRMPRVIVHDITQRDAQANRVEAKLIDQFNDFEGLIRIINPEVGRQ